MVQPQKNEKNFAIKINVVLLSTSALLKKGKSLRREPVFQQIFVPNKRVQRSFVIWSYYVNYKMVRGCITRPQNRKMSDKP